MFNRRSLMSGFAPLLCLILAAGGCSTAETFDPGKDRTPDERRAQFPIDHAQYGRVGYRLDWIGYPALTGKLKVTHFEAYQDVAVVLEQGSFLTIMEATTGQQRCADQLSNYLTKFSGFARDGDRIYTVSEGEIFTVDAQTCTMTTRQRTARSVGTNPVLYNNLLICGSVVGELFAHIAGGSVGGVKTWGFQTTGAFETRPVLIGSAVGAVSHTGKVVILDAQSGSLLGLNTLYGGSATDPVTDGKLMFVASLDQSIYALNPEGGTTVWRHRTGAPLRVQPTATADRLYCDVPGQGLTAFASGTGQVLWTAKGFHGTVIGTNKGRLIGWDGKEAALIDPARGDIIDRAPLANVQMLKTDAFNDGNLYVVSHSGVVAKFLPR